MWGGSFRSESRDTAAVSENFTTEMKLNKTELNERGAGAALGGLGSPTCVKTRHPAPAQFGLAGAS